MREAPRRRLSTATRGASAPPGGGILPSHSRPAPEHRTAPLGAIHGRETVAPGRVSGGRVRPGDGARDRRADRDRASRLCVDRSVMPVRTPNSRSLARSHRYSSMTFPSSLLGPTSRAQVDGLDPADGSKTSGHRYTWSVYKLSRQRIERIEHRARPGQDRVRLSPAPARAHLESINFDVRPSVHSGRLRGPSGLGPSPRAGTHGVALHFEIIAHYTFSCPAH